MSYLAIDTSGKHLTAIIEADGKIYTRFLKDCGVKHSVALMPTIEELEKESGKQIKDADFIACVVGAGSFTGIRIGVATAKALCFAYKKPALSITSFDTLAYNVKDDALAVIDAGHGGYYACGYKNGAADTEPSYLTEEEVLKLGKGRRVVSFERLDKVGAEEVSPADGLIAAIEAKKTELIPPEELTPLYIRKSQAEEGR